MVSSGPHAPKLPLFDFASARSTTTPPVTETFFSLPSLLSRLGELDPTAPTVVFCAGGYRSAIASSLLRSHGFVDVSDLIGGYTAWAARTEARSS